jgi:hypothetical protein
MKISIVVIFLLSTITFTYSQNKEQKNILYKFIEAHNIGSNDAITKFIEDTYHPKVYAKLNLKAHIAFYRQIVNEFGPLNFLIYKTVEETHSRCVVHLIKKEQYIQNKNINPLEILVVKIDLSKNDKNFMPHGLGLGSLVCEQKKE